MSININHILLIDSEPLVTLYDTDDVLDAISELPKSIRHKCYSVLDADPKSSAICAMKVVDPPVFVVVIKMTGGDGGLVLMASRDKSLILMKLDAMVRIESRLEPSAKVIIELLKRLE